MPGDITDRDLHPLSIKNYSGQSFIDLSIEKALLTTNKNP